MSESIAVRAPARFALATVATDFLERGANATIALRFALPAIGVRGLTLEKSVALMITPAPRHDGSAPLAIVWDAVDEPALPRFTGSIAAREIDTESATLCISGSYIPPGGLAGAIFDRLIGGMIARATLRALLAQFAAKIASDYAARSLM